MNFYYAATLPSSNDHEEIIISYNKELKKDFIAIIEYAYEFTAVKIKKCVSNIDALTGRYKPLEAIGYVDPSEYLERKQKQGQKAILMSQMEEKLKEMKTLEQFSKFTEKDPEFKAMYEALKSSTEKEQSSTNDNE